MCWSLSSGHHFLSAVLVSEGTSNYPFRRQRTIAQNSINFSKLQRRRQRFSPGLSAFLALKKMADKGFQNEGSAQLQLSSAHSELLSQPPDLSVNLPNASGHSSTLGPEPASPTAQPLNGSAEPPITSVQSPYPNAQSSDDTAQPSIDSILGTETPSSSGAQASIGSGQPSHVGNLAQISAPQTFNETAQPSILPIPGTQAPNSSTNISNGSGQPSTVDNQAPNSNFQLSNETPHPSISRPNAPNAEAQPFSGSGEPFNVDNQAPNSNFQLSNETPHPSISRPNAPNAEAQPFSGSGEPFNVDSQALSSNAQISNERGLPPSIQQPLSKHQQKKLLKQQYNEERKKARRAEEKERHHAKVAMKRKEREEFLSHLSSEERQMEVEKRMAERVQFKGEEKMRKRRLKEAMDDGQNIVIDLDFSDLMHPGELKSLMQQVMYSYAANARAAEPSRLTLTGCTGAVRDQLHKVSGFSHWMCHTHAESYMDVFKDRIGDLVYLTADSPNTTETLDKGKIYIIGGIVDRNRHKCVTYLKAEKDGIQTAKLPIGEHIQMLTSKVLTVNQVMEILLRYLECRDWSQSLLQVVPQRKLANQKAAEDPTSLADHPSSSLVPTTDVTLSETPKDGCGNVDIHQGGKDGNEDNHAEMKMALDESNANKA
eukprot:TRINITY_DN2374_c0_g1_i1.p1 TRINITY_DN2374_c0_g1~~TRINITY_DN2374_c0_g1_i1.p1  ORF type:complete len:656 (+),score=97.37 TRINITY_DN2374_c0_g1_i1:243-2210(+)